MAASIVDIADAIVVSLNGASLSMPLTAVRKYALQADLPEMKDLHVTVVPVGTADTGPGSRGQRQVDHQISLVFQKHIDDDADVDGLLLLVQEASDFLYGRRLSEATCMATANEPLLDVDHLRELRQFTSVLQAACRLYR